MRHFTPTRPLLRIIHSARLARLLAMLVVVVTTLLIAPASTLAAPPEAPPRAPGDEIPTVTIDVPDSGMINEPFTFTATFENTGIDVGYGPFIDIYLPSSVGVGVGSVNVTYLGMDLNAMGLVTTRTFNAAGQVTHPLAVVYPTGAAVVVSGGTQNDRMITIQLPYGSFTPGQPPAEVSITTNIAGNALVGTAVDIHARGGFRYGNTPLNDWCCVEGTRLVPNNSQPISSWPTDSITPTIMQVTKAYIGPGNTSDETATGPNFPRQYTITVDIANGQTVDTLQIVDMLPNNVQYLGIASSTPAGSIIGAAPGPGPGGTLTYQFSAPVTGTTATDDAILTIDFFVPINDSVGSSVINPNTGAAVTSDNTGSADGNWTNATAPNTGGSTSAVCVDCTHTLTDRSLAIQKAAADITAPTTVTRPNDIIEFTLDFQVSDFFAFQNLVIVDVLDDGYEFIVGSANVSVTEHGATAGSAIAPTVAVSGATGRTTLTFDISAALGAAQPLLGGCVPVGGTGGPPPDCAVFNGGPTTGRLTYRAAILEDYRIANPSGDTSVDHGDELGNSAVITGSVLNVSNLAPTANSVSDDAEASVTITQGELTKSVYAVNGAPPAGSPPTVSPGDLVTYRIEYTLPSSDTEYLTFIDYLPMPIFDAAEMVSMDDTHDNTAPAAGHAHFHTADTFSGTGGISGRVPVVFTNGTANSVEFRYGEYDLAMSPPSKVDILFTITVRNDPFTDGLFLTNQVRASESNSEGTVTATDGIVQVRLGEPVLSTTKSIVAITSSSPTAAINPAPPGGLFNAPGTAGNRWAVPPGATIVDVGNGNAAGMNGLDLVTFAIIIVNTGSSTRGAFDITITDTLQPDYQIPAAAPGLNLRVAYGDGTIVNAPGPSYAGLGGGPTGATDDDIFGNGIRIEDPGLAQGACEAPGHTPDRSYIIITYDLQIRSGVAPGQVIINTGSLTNYAGEEGGPNHLPEPLTDTARVTIGGTSGKSVDRVSMTVGESYTQTIDITIPPFTTAYQRGTSGRVYVRDRILDAGARMMPGSATFAQTATCSGTDMVGWIIGSQVLVSEIDQNPGSMIEWSLPAPIDNLANPNQCSFRVTVELMAVDIDTLGTPGPDFRAWAPPANNLALDDSARFEYGNATGSNINGPTSTAAVAIDQPWIRLVKSAPQVYESDGVTPRTGELRRGDFVVYLFTLENMGETTAYEVGVIDTLPEYMQYVGGSAFRDDGTGGGTAGDGIQNGAEPSLGNPSITGAPTPGGQTLTFNYDLDIPVGPADMVPVAFRAQVTNGMALGAVFVNIADANWSTLDGSRPTERVYDAIYDQGGPMDGLDTPGAPNQDRDTVTLNGIGLTLTKIFSPPIIDVGATSQLQLTVTNPNTTTTLTGISFFDNLPSGLVIAGAPALNPAACLGAGAAVDALVGGGNITVSNGTLAPGAVCRITLNVTSNTANVYNNTTSPITSTETGPGQTAADTLIVADTLAIHKRFSPTRVEVGQTSSLIFTIMNPTGGALTNVSFVDNLPSGLVVSGTLANPVCGGTLTAPVGGVTIELTGAALGAAGPTRYCTFSVGVQAQVPGTFTNQTEPISSTETGPTAPSNQAVLEAVQPAIQQFDPIITKTGDPSTAGIGDTVTWTITVTNPSSVAMPNVTVVDAVPDVLDLLGVETTQGTVTVNGNIVTVTIGTLDPGVTVTIRIRTVVSDRANPPVTITNMAFSGNSSASADLDILPGTLPPTGGRPVGLPLAVWLLLGAALALAAGWGVHRSRSAFSSRP